MQIQRTVFKEALEYINDNKIMLFVGARQTGKTTILKELKNTISNNSEATFFLNLEDPEYLDILNKHPKNIFSIFPIDLEKRTTLFIDEIQYLNNPSLFLKYIFDEYKGKIKLIVSGSSAFYIDQKFTDSLAGRKKIFHVRTLSFAELLDFRAKTKLSNKKIKDLTLEEKRLSDSVLREYMVYGGYPAVVLASIDKRQEILKELVYSYTKKDVLETGIRDSATFFKLFKILADQNGSLVNMLELANTLNVSKTAISNYLHIMQKSFHISLITPFAKTIRKEITKMPKVYFYDNGIRNFLVSNFDMPEKRKDIGSLLENTAFRILADKNDTDNLHFWRTTSGNEIDFVLNNRAYEVKNSTNSMQKQKYKLFMKQYPDIKFSFVSTNCDEQKDCVDVRDL